MPKLLHINASPRPQSYSLRLAEAFLDAFLKAHRNFGVETMDLFRTDIPVFEAPQAAAKYIVLDGGQPTGPDEKTWKEIIDVVDHFKSADMLLISTPMWNFSIPYRLKQYIDVIVQPGLTFSYSATEGYKGLVTGRPVVLALARGGNYPSGSNEAALDFQKPYLETILRFIGFTDFHWLIVEPTLMGEEAAQKALAAARAQAMEMAKNF
jgi:FMN-dependent NADH-azoreductase